MKDKNQVHFIKKYPPFNINNSLGGIIKNYDIVKSINRTK